MILYISRYDYVCRWNPPILINKWAPLTINATRIPPACPQPACDVHDILCLEVVSILVGCEKLNINLGYLDIRRLSLFEYLHSIAMWFVTASGDDFYSWWEFPV